MSAALQGIRVIDFGQYRAGPMAAMLLGDHGADVIRVEPRAGARLGGVLGAANGAYRPTLAS